MNPSMISPQSSQRSKMSHHRSHHSGHAGDRFQNNETIGARSWAGVCVIKTGELVETPVHHCFDLRNCLHYFYMSNLMKSKHAWLNLHHNPIPKEDIPRNIPKPENYPFLPTRKCKNLSPNVFGTCSAFGASRIRDSISDLSQTWLTIGSMYFEES